MRRHLNSRELCRLTPSHGTTQFIGAGTRKGPPHQLREESAMNFYDNPAAYAKRGIDYDLHACLEYNPQETFTVLDIKEVRAVYEGCNDERDWRWVLELHDSRFVFLQGGCDYTGWD